MRLVPLFAGAVEAEGTKISLATLARVLVAVDVDRGENDKDTDKDIGTDDTEDNDDDTANGNSGNERRSMPCYAIAGLYERLAELCDKKDHGEAREPRAGGLGSKQPALARPAAPPRRPLGRRRSGPAAAMATIAEGRRAPAPEIAVRIRRAADEEAPPLGPRLRFVRSRPAAAGEPLVFTDRVRVRPGGLVHVAVLRGGESSC